MIEIPERLLVAVRDDELPARRALLTALPGQIEEIASAWSLELADPCLPGGQCAWVAPARDRVGRKLVLKVAWLHWEAEREADALRLWDGDGVAARTLDDTTALLLERCITRVPLKHVLPEPEQDLALAGLLRPPVGAPSASRAPLPPVAADVRSVGRQLRGRVLKRQPGP